MGQGRGTPGLWGKGKLDSESVVFTRAVGSAMVSDEFHAEFIAC